MIPQTLEPAIVAVWRDVTGVSGRQTVASTLPRNPGKNPIRGFSKWKKKQQRIFTFNINIANVV